MRWISIDKTNHAIRWITIYPVDSVIQPLNNWGHVCNQTRDELLIIRLITDRIGILSALLPLLIKGLSDTKVFDWQFYSNGLENGSARGTKGTRYKGGRL